MSTLRKTGVYFKMSSRLLKAQPSLSTVRDVIRFFPDWWQHLNGKRNSVSDRTPWLTFGAIGFLEKIIKPDMVVFEYGSGGSTLFWSDRVSKVVSVEHNKEWYDRMSNEFEKQGISNVEYLLVEAEEDKDYQEKDPLDPQNYLSTDKEFYGKSFESYVRKIDEYTSLLFDIIIIDGRARPSCILHALHKIKEGGYIIVDNTDRGYYLSGFDFNERSWNKWTFRGPVPYNYDFSQTTVFQKKTL